MTQPGSFSLAVLIVLLSACTAANDVPLQNTTGSKYQPGQLWSYHSRAGEEESYLIILKVEEISTPAQGQLDTVVHVAVDGITMTAGDGTVLTSIPHMPFTEDAIDQSVISLLQSNAPLPNFQGGYDYWRSEFDKGEVGIFTITVGEAVAVVATSISAAP